jgi:predicted nucleic acid-binding protein
MRMLSQFHIAVFDQACAEAMERLRQRYRRRKRYADLMIAAMAIAGRHVVVTRNTADDAPRLMDYPACEEARRTAMRQALIVCI